MGHKRVLAVLAAATSLGVGAAVTTVVQKAGAAEPFALVTLRTADGAAVGYATFRNDPGQPATTVAVYIDVREDTTPVRTFRGFHVHANDNPDNGVGCVADPAQPATTWFTSADGHLKEGTDTHGAHKGDMPSIFLNQNGKAIATFTIDRFTPAELVNRAVILHAGADNFGNVPVGTAADQYTANSPSALTATQNTGNAGSRYACGVVVLL